MKIIAIIQARMGSTRLPGKMMKLLNDKPLIWYVINKVKQTKFIDKVILATSKDENNIPLIEEVKKYGMDYFIGEEADVLDRYYQCAKQFEADVIVRVTGDCPLIDSAVIDKVIKIFKENDIDYATNTLPPTYPDGLDVEVFSFETLEKTWKEASLKSEREHVTAYIRKHKEMFKCINLENDENLSNLRLTVDENEDLIFMNKLVNIIGSDNYDLKKILDVIKKNPELLKINNKFSRNEGYEKSLKKDKIIFEENIKWLAKAKKLIPAASQTYSKSYKYFCEGAAPAFLDRGEGAYVWDIDGNRYIDFVCGLGAITLGYNNEKVNKAIVEQLKKGISFTLSNILEVKLAEKLIEIIPCAEMVKFVKNGSDATTATIRLARAYTNKDVVAMSGYHGYHDWSIGTTENDRGVPKAVKELTKTFVYNDIDSLKKVFEENKDKVAAVILEPCHDKGPENNFLKEVKELAHKNGAVLIFDEVVSGFRMSIGGAQKYYGITPDLSSFGKGMGNGLSLSAIVGKTEIMKLIDEGVFISTTFGGETLALAGTLAIIEELEKSGSFEHIYNLGDLWLKEVKKLIEKKNLKDVIKFYGLPFHCGIVFEDKGNLSKFDLMTIYQQRLIQEGFLSLGVNNFCQTHTEEDIRKFIKAVDFALDDVKKVIEQDSVEGMIKGKKFQPIFRRN